MLTVRHALASIAAAGVCFDASAVTMTAINDALVVSDFFDDFELVDPAGPATTPMFVSPSIPKQYPTQIVLESAGTILFLKDSDVRRYDPATGLVTDLATTPGPFLRNIALEPDGSVIVNDNQDIYRINANTGAVTTIPNPEIFYAPQKVTVAPNGDIYIQEFFDGLIKVDPVTLEFTTVPTDVSFTNSGLIEALPNGDLAILAFGNDLYVFDPDTNTSMLVPYTFPSAFPSGSAIGSNGQFLLATNKAVYEIDLDTGASTNLSPIGGFFTPRDVVQGDITIIPEPASLALVGLGVLTLARRRRN